MRTLLRGRIRGMSSATGAVLIEGGIVTWVGEGTPPEHPDEEIVAAFIGWIRPELKFNAVGDLVQRMNEDSALAREKLARAGGVFPPIGGSPPGAPRL